MIAFIIRNGLPAAGLDARMRTALQDWRRQFSLFASTPVAEWTSQDGQVRCLWTAHNPTYIGDVRYVAMEPDAFALFSGRPVLWQNGEADGRTSLDARSYLEKVSAWSTALDGRHAVVRVDDVSVQVQTDPAGMQQLYQRHTQNAMLLTNIASLLAPVTSARRPRALASLLATGWGITAEPMNSTVTSLSPGTLYSFMRDGGQIAQPVHGPMREYFSATPDYAEAARLLVSLCHALADWPGRPHQLSITGGRDSRLIAAALRAAGVRPLTTTIAFPHQADFPDTEDVVLGRRVASSFGLHHLVMCLDRSAAAYRDPGLMASLVRLATPGTTALHNVLSPTTQAVTVPLPLNFSGTGGEVGRGTFYAYGDGASLDATAEALLRTDVPVSPTPLVNDTGLELLRQWARDFVARHADEGVALRDIPDIAFINRLGTWFGAKSPVFDYLEDPVAPLVSHVLWPHMLGQRLDDRRAQRFHRELTRLLADDLRAIPFDAVNMAHASKAESAVHVVASQEPVEDDGFAAIQAATRAAVRGQPDHEAWELLDRARVDTVLTAPPQAFDDYHSRAQLWRLATVFDAWPRSTE